MTPADSRSHTLHMELRSATRELHRRLDSHPILAPLTSPEITLPDYQRALRALHPIISASESSIGAYIQSHRLSFDFEPWRRTSELAQDLSFFGVNPAIADWPGPQIHSDGELVGCMYVLAGSAIGGRTILKHVHHFLGITSETGGRFFHGYGPQFSVLWQDFWRFAAACCPDGPTGDAAAGATSLFQSYIDWLNHAI